MMENIAPDAERNWIGVGMSDMTIEDALDYLDTVCVCYGCECWQDHDWGGCYRTTTTGKMACDLRDEAVEVLKKIVFREIE